MPTDIPADRNTFPIRVRFVKCFMVFALVRLASKNQAEDGSPARRSAGQILMPGTSISRLHNSFFQGFAKQAEALRPYRALQRGLKWMRRV